MTANGNRGGFTLIELMIVVIIIAALAGMVVPRLVPRSAEAKRKIAAGDIANIDLALEMFYLDNGFYPGDLNALMARPAGANNWKGPYLKTEPNDPWNRRYEYKFPGVHRSGGFDIHSAGPDGESGNKDDVTNWEKIQ
jgi:general secretion pathway protein G